MDVAVSGSRTINTYAYLRKAVQLHLSEAKAQEDGQFYRLMSVLVFSAFMLEAFFNHIGGLKSENWLAEERRLSQKKRFERIVQLVDLDIDVNTRPFSSVGKVFSFRDAMAHGKTQTLESHGDIKSVNWEEPHTSQFSPIAGWEELCTLDAAESLALDCESVVNYIYVAAGQVGDPFMSLSRSSFNLTRTDV